MKKILLFFLILILIIPITNGNVLLQIDKSIENDFFDSLVLKIMDHSHFPSVSVGIIKNNELVWSKGYGYSNREEQIQATDQSVYGICSITKTITGTALMQLFDQGFFDLDDDVNSYLPFSLRNPNFPDIPITFRMLLSHSSSLQSPYSYWNIQFERGGGPPFEGYPVPWLQDCLTPEGIHFDEEYWNANTPPGEVSAYANINFDIIGYLVELISGETFYEYCQQHIFEPLDMVDSGFNLSRYSIEQLAIPYIWNEQTGSFRKNYNQVHLHYPAGGLYSTVDDLSKFMIMHMNDGMYNGIQILEKSTVDEMHTIQPSSSGIGRAYGLAWLFESRSFNLGPRNVYFLQLLYGGHGGAVTFGLRTEMQMKLSDDIAVIFFVNSDSFMYKQGWNGIQFLKDLFFMKANNL